MENHCNVRQNQQCSLARKRNSRLQRISALWLEMDNNIAAHKQYFRQNNTDSKHFERCPWDISSMFNQAQYCSWMIYENKLHVYVKKNTHSQNILGSKLTRLQRKYNGNLFAPSHVLLMSSKLCVLLPILRSNHLCIVKHVLHFDELTTHQLVSRQHIMGYQTWDTYCSVLQAHIADESKTWKKNAAYSTGALRPSKTWGGKLHHTTCTFRRTSL